MHSNDLAHVSSDTSSVSIDFFRSLLGDREFDVWEALVNLGERTSIIEIARFIDRAPRTTRARVFEMHKKGIFEYGKVGSKCVGRQGVRSYRLRCIPEVADVVKLPCWLLGNLSNRQRRGRPKKNSVCTNEIASTEQKNRWLVYDSTQTTEHKNTMATFSDVVEDGNSSDVLQKKYMATCWKSNAVSANTVKNQITPLRGLLHACARRARIKLNLNLSNLLMSNELARGFFSFEKEKNALRAISFFPENTEVPKLLEKTKHEPEPISLAPTIYNFDQPLKSVSTFSGEETPTGFKLGGTAFDSTWDYEGVPPYPTAKLVHPIEVPAPPRIDPSWTEDEQLSFLGRVWTATIEHKTGQMCWTLRARRQGKGKNKKLVHGIDRHRDELLRAIELCVEHKLQPGPWIAFSFDEWSSALSKAEQAEIEKNTKTKSRKRKRRRSSSAPPIKWVFAESRIQDRAGWYGHVLERQLYRGIIRFTARHKKLISMHTAMRFALMALSSPSQRQVDKIVDRFLPERYELLVRQCNADTAREQERLNKRAREGEWLWQ